MNIGEAARASGCHVETIRYYERVGLMPPPGRSPAGYRTYTHEQVERLRFIHRARGLGFGLEEIRELLALAAHADQPCDGVNELAARHLQEVRARQKELARMAAALEALIASCHGRNAASCTIIGALRGDEALPEPSRSSPCPGL
jgi:MerR family mercuric resistance operon transcriptional regulator